MLVNDSGPNGAGGAEPAMSWLSNLAPAAWAVADVESRADRQWPGGMGGAANADFDSLIDLIVSTVANDTWVENGSGEAEIRPFPTNLSLVISQTQAVHEQIADLLEQLRRLQDLQVTIEVRFIRLNDSFFERIGVDFDMNIGPAANQNVINPDGTVNQDAPSSIVGARPAVVGDLPAFTNDLEVPISHDSFPLATAPFRRSATGRRTSASPS